MTINENDDTIIWGQRTLNLSEEEINGINNRRQLNMTWELEEAESFSNEVYDKIIGLHNRMTEQIENSIDRSILESIVGIQPMEDSLSEIFHFDFDWNKRKKLDLKLPDELFEME